MAFFLIVPSVMIVSIFFVHALANRLGLRIYYTTLIAVAVLSFMVVFASTFIVPVAGRDYLLRLGLIIAAVTFLVTLANNFLLNKERDEERRFTEEVKAAYAAEVYKDALIAQVYEPFEDMQQRYNESDKPVDNADKLTDAEQLLAYTDKPAATAESVDNANKLTDAEQVLADTDKPAATAEPVDNANKLTDAEQLLADTDKPAATAESVDNADKLTDAEQLLAYTDKPAATAEPVDNADKPTDAEQLLADTDKLAATAEPVDNADKLTDVEQLLADTDKPAVSDNVDNADKLTDAEQLLAYTDKPAATAEPVDNADKPTDAEQVLADTDKPAATAEPVDNDDKLTDAEQLLADTDKPTDATLDAEPDDSGKFPLDKVFKPLAEVKPEEADKPVELEDKPDPADNFPLDEVFKPLPEVKNEEANQVIKKPVDKPKRVEMFPLQEVFTPLSNIRLDKIEELTQEQRESSSPPPQPTEDIAEIETDDVVEVEETLDDILDKAYNERSKGHTWQAIDLYKKALERYRNDEYAPFVAIDLGNVYKEQALYSKAIKIYEAALSLPAVKRNADIKREFTNNLAYLRVVRDVLLKYHALSTPFDKLSKEILHEIDTEFQKVQINFRE